MVPAASWIAVAAEWVWSRLRGSASSRSVSALMSDSVVVARDGRGAAC